MNDIQGKKIVLPEGGTCIYCGANGGAGGLGEEHVVPYALGGKTTLSNASCNGCSAITSYLDGYLASATYKYLRVHSGVQSRSGHPDVLPAYVGIEGGEITQIDLAPCDHPYFLHMPVWHPPGLMRGEAPTPEFKEPKAHVYWYVPPNMRDTLALRHGQTAEIQDKTPMPNVRTFARAVAKIAYCNAIIHYGLNGFRPLALPDIILGRYPHISLFVGSDRGDPPPPDPKGILHKLTFTNVNYQKLNFYTMRLRLFAHSGTDTNGMPYYEVVIGAPGPGNTHRRTMPKLPKIICL